jgi:hypothetical protein
MGPKCFRERHGMSGAETNADDDLIKESQDAVSAYVCSTVSATPSPS